MWKYSILGHFYAARAAYFQKLRDQTSLANFLAPIVHATFMAAMLAWIVSRGAGTAPIAYISIGVFLMYVWNWGTFATGWGLRGEFFQGTIDHNLVSRTPMMVIMFGKALAGTTSGIPAGVVAFVVAVLVSKDLLAVGNPALFAVSLIMAMIAISAAGMILAPLFLMSQGGRGSFNLVGPVGIMLSGFAYPISLFSESIEVVARFLPTTWAMEGIVASMEPGDTSLRIAGDLGASVGLSALYLGLAYLLFRKVEHRIRVDGSLGTF